MNKTKIVEIAEMLFLLKHNIRRLEDDINDLNGDEIISELEYLKDLIDGVM